MANKRGGNASNTDIWDKCNRIAWVLAVALAVCGLISVWSYSQHNESDWQYTNVDLRPTIKYFDANRNLKPITDIVSVDALPSTASDVDKEGCDAGRTAENGWERIFTLTTWRGIDEGCIKGSNILKSNCKHAMKNGDAIPRQLPVNLNRWKAKDKELCVQRVLDINFKKVDDNEKSCGEGLQQCGCHCIKDDSDGAEDSDRCPISEWRYHTGARSDDMKDWEQMGGADDDENEYVQGTKNYMYWLRASDPNTQVDQAADVTVEYYGVNCINPQLHPADPKDRYVLLSSVGTGCGTFGADTEFALQADSQQEWTFYENNDNVKIESNEEGATLSKQLLAINQYKDLTEANKEFQVYLINRQRIRTKCNFECDTFHFGEEAEQLLRYFAEIWGTIRKLGVASLSAAVLAISMLVLFQLESTRKQSQNRYTILFATCLVGLFCSVILIYNASQHIKHKHGKLHRQYVKAHDGDCLESAEWKNVLAQFVRHTSLGKLGNQLFYALTTFVCLLVTGSVFAIWALMQISNSAQRSQVEQQ